jgi:MscS family membrane protein
LSNSVRLQRLEEVSVLSFPYLRLGLCTILLSSFAHAQKPAASAKDPLGRENPRSTVTEFLQACGSKNYQLAEQYLDLSRIPARTRAHRGVELAQGLEAILNQSRFSVLRLSQEPEGNLSDDPNPAIEHVTKDTANTVELERVQLQPGTPQIWLFSSESVAKIPALVPNTTESSIEAHLPRFLVSFRLIETPLWKWLALLIAAIILISLFRLLERLLLLILRQVEAHLRWTRRWEWLVAILQPLLIFLAAAGFRIAEEIVAPSALARVYIGDLILLVVVCSVAWCLINLVELFLTRVDSLLDPRQRVVSRSLLYLGRRTTRVVIFVVAGIFVLTNWGYPMTTIIAGLGVGGIAVALAAQQTIANVFGGVSVIGDHPVMVGDFGSFGGLLGEVEDIGMRSTRIRTLSRTIVSIPNSAFAGMNLENYSLRDKILFNATIQIKRATSKEQVRHLMDELADMLRKDKRVEVGPTPIRISGLTAAAFAVEMFAYVLSADIDTFYKIEAELFLEINQLVTTAGIELV